MSRPVESKSIFPNGQAEQLNRTGHSSIRPMEPAGAGIERVVAASLRRAPSGRGPLLAWPVACGQAVAARTSALDFAHGILRVEVPDASWRAELQSLASQYLAVVNRYTSDSVKRIEFVIADKAAGATPETPAPHGP